MIYNILLKIWLKTEKNEISDKLQLLQTLYTDKMDGVRIWHEIISR